jgi:hypothetical protein
MIKVLVGLAFVLEGTLAFVQGAVLNADTLRAWREYVAAADSRMKPRLTGQLPFLWTDESPERRRRVLAGQTVIAPLVGDGFKSVPQGLIHHWIGAIFIPNASVRQLLTVLHEYDRYKDFFQPFVADSRLCASSSSDHEFSMIFQYHVVFGSLVVESRYSSKDFAIDDRRHYSIADSVRVQEIAAYGTAGERRLPPGTGAGFVWGLHSIARYEQRDGGVYLEMEALALSRSIPGALRWFVGPLVRRMSIGSLDVALQKTRNAVMGPVPAALEAQSISAKPGALSVCDSAARKNPPGVAPLISSK